MTPRSIRRAAERRANKLARKSTQDSASAPADSLAMECEDAVTETATIKTPEPTIIPAAEANLHLSAVPSVLTGHVALIPTTDAEPYDQLLRDYQNEYRPVGFQELNLVQTLAEINWRMRRIMALEMAIFAKGGLEFASQFAEYKPGVRESLLEVHTFLTYEKQLRSLQLQEARLARRVDKASAELRTLQQERRKQEAAQPRQPQAPAKVNSTGFVFSNPQNAPAKPNATQPPGVPLRAEAA